MRFRDGLIITSILGLQVIVASGQAPKPSEVGSPLKAESRLVVVDTVVTDKKGNYLRDLAPKEFHLFEDNEEQVIESVARESAASTQANAPSYTVLFFGQIPLADQPYVRDAGIKFIDANAGPGRQIAVLNYKGNGGLKLVQGFTSDKERLKQAVRNAEATGMTALGAPGDAGLSGQIMGGSSYHMNSEGESTLTVRTLLHAITGVSEQMATLPPGRKTVIVLTPTINYSQQAHTDPRASGASPFDSNGAAQMGVAVPAAPDVVYYLQPEELAQSIESCNKSNVAIYMVDVQTNHSSAQNQFGPFAEGTGGFATQNSTSAVDALWKIGQDQVERYVITYTPAKSAKGSCHKLRVKTDRPGAIVRARNEYCNIDSKDPLAGTQLSSDLEALARGQQPGNMAVHMLPAFFYAGANAARVQVTADVPTDSITFTKQNNRFRAVLNVLGIAEQADGKVGGRFSDTLTLDFETKKQADDFKQRPFHYEAQFSVPSGHYNLQVVFSSAPDNFGKVEAPLVIESWDGNRFAMSGIALSRESRKIAPSEQESFVPVRRTPMISRDLQFIPASSNRYKKADPAMLFVEVYDPLLNKPNPPKVRLQLMVLDPASGTIKMDSGLLDMSNRVREDKSVVPIGLRLPTDKLEPGKYLVVLKASDSAGGISGVRSAEIQLE